MINGARVRKVNLRMRAAPLAAMPRVEAELAAAQDLWQYEDAAEQARDEERVAELRQHGAQLGGGGCRGGLGVLFALDQ